MQIWDVLRERLLFGDNGGFVLAASELSNHVADPSA
jgi:hypothetical protein